MRHITRSAPVIGLTTEHSKLVFGFNTISLILASSAVCLRIYARRLSKKSFVAEDFLVFLALVPSKQTLILALYLIKTLDILLRLECHDILWWAVTLRADAIYVPKNLKLSF